MKSLKILLSLLFIINSLFSQELTVKSKFFGQKRKVLIKLPDNYTNTTFDYPVIYLLDGQVLFDFLKGLYQYNSDKYPSAILVGIIQEDRVNEFVEHKDSLHNQEIYSHFSDFFVKELIPLINSKYRTNSLNIFIGHSFGGIFLLKKMLMSNKINNTICISPTIWVDNYRFLQDIKEYSSQQHKWIYLGCGEYDFTAIKRGVEKLSTTINEDMQNCISVTTDIYCSEDHNSSILVGVRKGLNYFFEGFTLPEDKWVQIEKTGNDTIFNNYFNQLSDSLNCKILPSEEDYNQLGYYYLEKERIDEAKQVFLKNIKLHSYSSNTYDSYGDVLMEVGDYHQALKYYTKAIKIERKNENDKYQLQQYQEHIELVKKKINNTY